MRQTRPAIVEPLLELDIRIVQSLVDCVHETNTSSYTSRSMASSEAIYGRPNGSSDNMYHLKKAISGPYCCRRQKESFEVARPYAVQTTEYRKYVTWWILVRHQHRIIASPRRASFACGSQRYVCMLIYTYSCRCSPQISDGNGRVCFRSSILDTLGIPTYEVHNIRRNMTTAVCSEHSSSA